MNYCVGTYVLQPCKRLQKNVNFMNSMVKNSE